MKTNSKLMMVGGYTLTVLILLNILFACLLFYIESSFTVDRVKAIVGLFMLAMVTLIIGVIGHGLSK